MGSWHRTEAALMSQSNVKSCNLFASSGYSLRNIVCMRASAKQPRSCLIRTLSHVVPHKVVHSFGDHLIFCFNLYTFSDLLSTSLDSPSATTLQTLHDRFECSAQMSKANNDVRGDEGSSNIE